MRRWSNHWDLLVQVYIDKEKVKYGEMNKRNTVEVPTILSWIRIIGASFVLSLLAGVHAAMIEQNGI